MIYLLILNKIPLIEYFKVKNCLPAQKPDKLIFAAPNPKRLIY